MSAHDREDSQDQIPFVVDGLDWNELTLSREEGFVFSRIDGTNSVKTIIESSGLSAEKGNQLLTALHKKGAIVFGNADTAGPSQIDLSIDLAADTQHEIQKIYNQLDSITFYQLLGVERDSDEKNIKRAYFRISKKYHPDSYFRKNLGEYKSKIEKIFKQCSKAYEVLSNPKKRAAYDLTLPYQPTKADEERRAHEQQRVQSARKLREEKRKRILRNSPVARKRAQARKHYEDALEHKKNNDPLKAANSIRLALVLEPDNPTYQQILEDVGPKAGQIRSENEYKRGRYEESIGNDEEALTSYLRAIECNPEDSKALHRAAALLLHAKREIKMALTFCRKAQQLEPNVVEITRTLADLYYEMGMMKNALREYTRLLQMNPFDDFANDRIKELRKL